MSDTAAELEAASGRTPPPSPNKKADVMAVKKAELVAAKKAERAAVKRAEQQEKRLEQLRGKVSVLQDQLKVLMQQMHTTVEVRGGCCSSAAPLERRAAACSPCPVVAVPMLEAPFRGC